MTDAGLHPIIASSFVKMSATTTWQNDGFGFLIERSLSQVSISNPHHREISDNILSFLALVQHFRIQFLEITWQSVRPEIGRGGTSKITEALANLSVSFAFKRFTNQEHEHDEQTEAELYRTFSNKVIVLSQEWARQHPNIVQLEGICWEVCSDNRVLPVLVFEKSQLGDLFSFIRSPFGRTLDMQRRFQLCCEVGKTVTDMHFQGRCEKNEGSDKNEVD